MEDQLSFFSTQEQSASTPLPIAKTLSWTIHIDGASRGNPGPSGAGIYITCNKKSAVEKGIYLGTKTNNQAEYLALALALYFLNQEIKTNNSNGIIMIISDSELLIRQMQGRYKVKNDSLKSIKMVIDTIRAPFQVTFKHVLREYNKDADALANLGIDKKHPMPVPFKKLMLSHGVEL